MIPWGVLIAHVEAVVDSSQWDDRYSSSDLVWSAGPNRWVEEVANELVPGTALDLAGGEGRNALWLAEQGWRATLVDFSQRALDRAASLASQRWGDDVTKVTSVCADLAEYVPPPSAFDLVMLVYLQVPADLRGHVVRMAASAVAPGGHLLVVAHHSRNLVHGVGGPQDPAVLYTAEDIAADLLADGREGGDLEVERCEEVLRDVPGDSDAGPAIDALFLARRPVDASRA